MSRGRVKQLKRLLREGIVIADAAVEELKQDKSIKSGEIGIIREVNIPVVYEVNTGKWLNVCGITYDEKENIIEIDAWDGDGVKSYKKGEFELEEDNITPLYQK